MLTLEQAHKVIESCNETASPAELAESLGIPEDFVWEISEILAVPGMLGIFSGRDMLRVIRSVAATAFTAGMEFERYRGDK